MCEFIYNKRQGGSVLKRKIFSLILVLALAVFPSGCSLENIASDISNTLHGLSGIGGEAVEIITEEIVSIEPDAVPTDGGNLYCYRSLSKQQKRLYRIILAAAKAMTEGFFSLGAVGDSFNRDINVAYEAVINDHPEIFWMPYTYLINGGTEAIPQVSLALSYKGSSHSCSYLISSSEKEKMEQQLEAAVKKITEKASGVSHFDAELIIHDEICKKAVYTEGEPESLVYTAFGALVNGKAVCEGYSRAMQLLCGRLGIPCALISGDSRGTGHMWNLINPGDGWYHLDVTWDDNASGEPYYIYFNLCDAELITDHSISPLFSETAAEAGRAAKYNILSYDCSNTSYNYFRYKNLILDEDYAAQAAMAVSSAYKRGAEKVTMRFVEQNTRRLFEKSYNSCVTEIQKILDKLSEAEITDISLMSDTITFYWKQQ